MKKMAKMIAMCLAGAMLASCGVQGGSSESGAGTEDTTYKVGIVQYADHPSLDNCRTGFIEGLKENGFEEGKNLEVDFQAAQGNDSMNTQIAQTFASSGMDLVCGIATPSAQALYVACLEKDIPVIFNAISDPVSSGLAKSETEPMEGITGISDLLPVEDQLKLIREILPDAKKIGILYTTSEANSVSTIELYKELAPEYGFEIIDRGIAKQAEVTQAADILLNEVDCLSNLTDNTVVSALSVVLEKANAKNIPVFGSEEEQVKNGCIASAGLDYVELGRQAGAMAARVLNGEAIETIPFETIKESKLTVNTAVAQSLGITIPETILESAEAVGE